MAVTMPLYGQHNVANALAGVAVARHLGLPLTGIAAALARFRGTRRRMEFKGGVAARSIAIFDDYAHHPTEIRVNLAALRARFPGRRLRCVFQPHTYSRTRDLLDDFAGCFDDADEVVLTEIYAARETDTLGISGADLAAAVQRARSARPVRPVDGSRRGPTGPEEGGAGSCPVSPVGCSRRGPTGPEEGGAVRFCPTLAEAVSYLEETLAPGDVIVTMGAGNVGRVGEDIVQWLNA
jgi:UDP-N-acetylmuramate-alanine ligase